MPRDYMAGLTQYFFPEDGKLKCPFLEFQMESVAVISARLPHWPNRKVIGNSLYQTVFSMIQDTVEKSNDDIAKELFVEAFHSREKFIEVLLDNLEKVDRVEQEMKDGTKMRTHVPDWLFDEHPC